MGNPDADMAAEALRVAAEHVHRSSNPEDLIATAGLVENHLAVLSGQRAGGRLRRVRYWWCLKRWGHEWSYRPGQETLIASCDRCDYTIGF